MRKDPLTVKIKRFISTQWWVFKCLTRKFWDKTYPKYIFKNIS